MIVNFGRCYPAPQFCYPVVKLSWGIVATAVAAAILNIWAVIGSCVYILICIMPCCATDGVLNNDIGVQNNVSLSYFFVSKQSRYFFSAVLAWRGSSSYRRLLFVLLTALKMKWNQRTYDTRRYIYFNYSFSLLEQIVLHSECITAASPMIDYRCKA